MQLILQWRLQQKRGLFTQPHLERKINQQQALILKLFKQWQLHQQKILFLLYKTVFLYNIVYNVNYTSKKCFIRINSPKIDIILILIVSEKSVWKIQMAIVTNFFIVKVLAVVLIFSESFFFIFFSWSFILNKLPLCQFKKNYEGQSQSGLVKFRQSIRQLKNRFL